jgi:4-amino-4-deoxy-L-arabinose transferase-like glycosyltransferase
VPVNLAITIISRFSASSIEYESGSRDVRAARQHETPHSWRERDWQVAGALALLAAALNFVRLPPLAELNLYYATAVKSMTMSWSNFFFVSFDPGGFVSVDKPPLGLWLQALSVRVLGFNSFSLILPQAIAGTLSVVILYVIVRRRFGRPAGVIAGALLATSPINVVVNRSNIFESQLVLTSLLVALAILTAVRHGSLRWLLVSAVFIGVGFNIKSFAALLVVPACIGLYALGAPLTRRHRLIHVALFLAMLTAVSLCWIETVDHISSSQRPWVDSTLSNSEADLALNYNGLQRLVGQPKYSEKPQQIAAGIGQPGPFRLLQAPLAPQASWFLPLALIGLFAANWGNLRWRKRASPPMGHDAQRTDLVFWSIWLVTTLVFFSMARFYNPYYLALLTPAVCALAGIGAVGLWREYSAAGWRGRLLLVAVFSTGTAQLFWLTSATGWNPWLIPILAGMTTVATLSLIIQRRLRLASGTSGPRAPRAAMRLGVAPSIMLALAVAPAAWLAGSYDKNNSGWFPISGPVEATGNAFGPAPADARLVAYLSTHHGRQHMLLATIDAFDAIPIILATGQPVMAMGGYSKYDPILTPRSLARAVARGEVRYFLLPISNLTPDQMRALYPNDLTGERFQTHYTNALTQWVSGVCQPIPPQAWSSQSAPGSLQLFSCDAPAASAKAIPTV